MSEFDKYNISEDIKKSIKRLGFTKPSMIQDMAFNPIFEGKDILGESSTGSGKTLAFGAGIIDKAELNKGIQALVLAPTRELACQVKSDLDEIAHFKKIKVTAIYGGVSIDPQFRDLKNSEVVVATPGRLKDHIERKTVDLSKVKILVLDEADRMLDMGFVDDIEFILKRCPKERQTLFFSATIPFQIEKLSKKYLKNPVKLAAEKMVDPSKLTQIYYDVKNNLKLSLLVQLLKNESVELAMVFCNTRRSTDLVVKNLKANKVKAIAIHGGFAQNKRSKTMEVFNNGKTNVLVCTDVAARGLHIEGVSHIYNYDLPDDSNIYVHRIGRTARAGKEGIVVNLLCDRDHDNFAKILREHRDFKIRKEATPYVQKASFSRADDSDYGNRGYNRQQPQYRGKKKFIRNRPRAV